MMIEKIGKAAMLEQLAEEASELSQAALKMARVIRNENPTPVTMEQCEDNLEEEFTDVSLRSRARSYRRREDRNEKARTLRKKMGGT